MPAHSTNILSCTASWTSQNKTFLPFLFCPVGRRTKTLFFIAIRLKNIFAYYPFTFDAGQWRDSHQAPQPTWPTVSPQNYVNIWGRRFFTSLQPLRDSVVCTHELKKLQNFLYSQTRSEKFPTFNECLFSHLKSSHSLLKHSFDPSTAIEMCFKRGPGPDLRLLPNP